ncbi:MAG: 30S ribosomal protein S13 [Thermoplasmata archaeon]|nr:30S ribosomal protein S13 [Thermoplasmata archaeon]
MSPPPEPRSKEAAKPAAEPGGLPEATKDAPKEKGAKGKGGGKGKTAKGPAPETQKKGKPIPDNPNFRYIVRFAGVDLDGRRSVVLALGGVRGIGPRIAETTVRLAGINAAEMIGNVPEATVDGLEELVHALPSKVPAWMVNHTTDRTTGETTHLIGGDLDTGVRDDTNQMKMIRSYKGVRHERGQKVRGQRTRSNGRTGMAAGVLKKAAKEAAAAAAAPAGPAGPPGTAPAATGAPAAAAAAPTGSGTSPKGSKPAEPAAGAKK